MIMLALVAKGYSQKEQLDFHDTFSPVAKMVSVRTVITLAASREWSISQMDVSNAFLQGDLYEDVYMHMPQGFCRKGEKKVCKLVKSFYGLKQASRKWNIKLTDALIKAGYAQSSYDHSLFTKKEGMDIAIILVYVDDLLITGSTPTLIEDAKRTLHSHFKMKDLGDLRYFLGIEVMRSKGGILLNQRKYSLKLISEVGLSGARPASTPLETNHKLTIVDFDIHMGIKNDLELEDVLGYQKLIGKVIYLTIIRPDICFAVQVFSQFMQSPKQSNLEVTMSVVRYLKGSARLGLFFPSNT